MTGYSEMLIKESVPAINIPAPDEARTGNLEQWGATVGS
jgi:hypothetical protein